MALPKYLFWWAWVKKMIWDPFWWLICFAVILWVPFLRVWWWIFLPVMLSAQLRTLYLWWINWDFDFARAKWVMLEIVPPKEILAPFKAMEDVFSTLWTTGDHPVFREEWCDGELNYIPYWHSWEIVSIEGRIHFYVRCLGAHRLAIETTLYAHYPEIEIREASDYVKLVPPTAPNDEWDAYGEDFVLGRPDVLPIKTYEKFFEPQGERIQAEEKRMDPMISLLEAIARLGPGEHYWMQFIAMPAFDKDEPNFKKDAEKFVAKVAKRPQKKEPTLFEELLYTFGELLMGPHKEGSGDKASYSWLPMTKEESGEREMVLTPGEREIITEVENKAKKPTYKAVLRGVYVAKRENWVSAHRIIARGYFSHFGTSHMNYISFAGETRPKLHYFMRQRRAFLRARRMFRNAVLRLTPLFPDRKRLISIYSPEELATIFHFPVRSTGMVAPTLENVQSKKGGPPPNLPIE